MARRRKNPEIETSTLVVAGAVAATMLYLAHERSMKNIEPMSTEEFFQQTTREAEKNKAAVDAKEANIPVYKPAPPQFDIDPTFTKGIDTRQSSTITTSPVEMSPISVSFGPPIPGAVVAFNQVTPLPVQPLNASRLNGVHYNGDFGRRF